MFVAFALLIIHVYTYTHVWVVDNGAKCYIVNHTYTYDMSLNGQMQFSKHIIIVFHEGSNYMVFVDECVGRISDNLVTGTWLGNHLFCLGRIHLILALPCSESHK